MKTVGVHGFYPVVDDVRWVRRFLPLGARTIQLRIKERSASEVQRQIREALAVAADYDDCQLIINDYWWEAINLGAHWLHLGQDGQGQKDQARKFEWLHVHVAFNWNDPRQTGARWFVVGASAHKSGRGAHGVVNSDRLHCRVDWVACQRFVLAGCVALDPALC